MSAGDGALAPTGRGNSPTLGFDAFPPDGLDLSGGSEIRFALGRYSGSSLSDEGEGPSVLILDDGSRFTFRSIETPYGNGVIAYGEPLDGQLGILFVGLTDDERMRMLASIGSATPQIGQTYGWVPADLVAVAPEMQVASTHYEWDIPVAARDGASSANRVMVDAVEAGESAALSVLGRFITPHALDDPLTRPLASTRCEDHDDVEVCAWFARDSVPSDGGAVTYTLQLYVMVTDGTGSITLHVGAPVSEGQFGEEALSTVMQERLDLLAGAVSRLRGNPSPN